MMNPNYRNTIKPYQRFDTSKASLNATSWNRYKTCATADSKLAEIEAESELESDSIVKDKGKNIQADEKNNSLASESELPTTIENISNYIQRSATDQSNTSNQRKRDREATSSEEQESNSPKLKKLKSFNQISSDSSVEKQDLDSKDLLPDHSDYLEALPKVKTKNFPKNLIGRELELIKIENFIESHVKNQSSGSMYVYGAPGSGKTACLLKVISKSEFQKAFKIIYIDCRSVKSTKSIYSKICEELHLQKYQPDKTFIRNYLSKPHTMLLVILHEMDQLKTRCQADLCPFFEWPSMKNSKLVVIGTASSSDLIVKLLPKLIVSKQYQPTLLKFQSY